MKISNITYKITGIDIHCYKFSILSIIANMYVIICNNKAIIIDPNMNDDVLYLLNYNNVESVMIMLTHEHYDHISGVNWLKSKYNAIVICTNECGKNIVDPSKNISRYYEAMFNLSDKTNKNNIYVESKIPIYICTADITFQSELKFNYNNYNILIKETPGHSKSSSSIIMNNEIIFTGDSLLKNISVNTRFPGGSRNKYYEETIPFYKSLCQNLMVFPGHGDTGILSSLLSEVKSNVA